MAASEPGPRVAPRTHVSATLFRNRGFADVTHLGIWNAAGFRAGRRPSGKCPYVRERRGEWAEKGKEEKPRDDGGRGHRDPASGP